MDRSNVSSAVIRRLPRYYRYINELYLSGVARVSSKALAERMGLTASQIRQDLNCFGGFGQQGYGYNVEHLKNELAAILKLDQSHTAIIIGAGNLGRALINNFNFGKSGFSVLAAFNANPAMSDTKVGSTPVLHVSRLDEFLSRTTPDIAVLTLPKTEAQAMAKRLIEHGVRGLWNFTSADLHIDNPDAVVENVHFSESLMIRSYRI